LKPPEAPRAALPALVKRVGPLTWLRNNFLYGVAVVLPFAVTFWLLWSIVGFIDDRITPLLPGGLRPRVEAVPGAGLVIAVAGLTLLGALAANLIGRTVVRLGERLVGRLPLVRSIYGGAKQVLENVSTPQRQSFKRAVLFEFPRPGVWTIGFVTNEAAGDISDAAGSPLVAVYVPQVPVPTTGFLQYLREEDLRPLPFGPEEALKVCISLGMLNPAQSAQPPQAQQLK
jgi:uncharacterized membrane protein